MSKVLIYSQEDLDLILELKKEENEELQQENQQLKNDINKLQKELNEENLQCSKYSIEFNDLKEKNKQLKEVINKAKTLNHEISHTIYEDFLEENIIGSKFLYERIKKQLSILEDKEVSE